MVTEWLMLLSRVVDAVDSYRVVDAVDGYRVVDAL